MNIFIWESYGNIQVFETETDEAIRKLLRRIMSIVKGWDEGVEDEVEKLFHVLDTEPDTIRAEIHKFFNRHNKHKEFIYGRFSKTIPL